MPAYQDTSRNTWYVEVHTTIDGQIIRKKKRGLSSKKLALEWERDCLSNITYNLNMNMGTLIEKYIEEKKIRWKINTYVHRCSIANSILIPYFSKFTFENVTAKEIMSFQNHLTSQGKTSANIIAIEKMLSSIFNYICTYYNIGTNEMKKIKKIGKVTRQDNSRVWSEDNFIEFIKYIKNIKVQNVNVDNLILIYSILFYTGLRVGELTALNWQDIDLDKQTLRVSKTLYKRNSKDHVSPPKTENSNRLITLDDDLVELIRNYKKKVYDVDGRILAASPQAISHQFKFWSGKLITVPDIRLHDLRHSHATMLLSKGAPIGAISRRLGHANISITLNTYSHVLTEDNDRLMNILNK